MKELNISIRAAYLNAVLDHGGIPCPLPPTRQSLTLVTAVSSRGQGLPRMRGRGCVLLVQLLS